MPAPRRRRDADADAELRRVYRTHVRAVYAFFGYSLSREAAEDLTSQTFEKVIKAWKRFDPEKAGERTWILSIARNVLTDHYRRESLRRTVSTDAHPVILDRLVDDGDPLRSEMSVTGFVERLRDLTPDAREVLALRFGADMTASEIAEATGHSEANVHQLVSRSLRKLRARADEQAVSDDSASRSA